MCNLYSQFRSRDEIRRLFSVERDLADDLPSQPSIYPDQMASVIRLDDDGARVMQQMRWGFPPPPMGNRPVANVRNTNSTFWRSWLKPAYRCLVPATSFCEYSGDQPKVPHWFALNADRPPFAFAGIWRPWTGLRGKAEGRPASASCAGRFAVYCRERDAKRYKTLVETNQPGTRRYGGVVALGSRCEPDLRHMAKSQDAWPAPNAQAATASAIADSNFASVNGF
jgi:hypothetical protein